MDTAPDTTAAYPRRMLKDASLSTLALRVWGRCFQLACLQMGGAPDLWSAKAHGGDVPLDEAQIFTASVRNLAHKVGCSRPAARKGIVELVDGGYLQGLEPGGYALPWTVAELFKQGNFQRIQRPPDSWTNAMRRLFFVLHIWPARKAWVNQADLARRCGMSRRAVMRATSELERASVIDIQRRAGKSHLIGCRMAVSDPLPDRLPMVQDVTTPGPRCHTPMVQDVTTPGPRCHNKVTDLVTDLSNGLSQRNGRGKPQHIHDIANSLKRDWKEEEQEGRS